MMENYLVPSLFIHLVFSMNALHEHELNNFRMLAQLKARPTTPIIILVHAPFKNKLNGFIVAIFQVLVYNICPWAEWSISPETILAQVIYVKVFLV